MKHPLSIIRLLIAGLCSIGYLTSPVAATGDAITHITLRSTVRIASGNTNLTIAQVAQVTGPQQDTINQTPLDLDTEILAGQWTSIRSEQIRAILKQSPTINTGSIVLTGTTIAITRRSPPKAAPKQLPSKSLPTTRSDQPTLQSFLERWIYARLKSTPKQTRIQFADRDRKLLDSLTTGQTIEITETGRSSKMSLRVVIYQDERIIADSTIRADVQILRRVRVATSQIARRTMIDSERSAVESRWLSPVVPVADPEKSLDLVCKKTIDAGSILLESMLESPVLVERGEIVSATSLSGTVSVAMSVRARTAGRLGELIELESRDRKRRFTARIAGPGRVVIINKESKTPAQSAKAHQ